MENIYLFDFQIKTIINCGYPPGFAHGFCVLSKEAKVEYKCTEFYKPKDEYTLKWNDNELKINWPIKKPIVSEKDSLGLTLEEIKI